jgi:phage-related minor tail protein
MADAGDKPLSGTLQDAEQLSTILDDLDQRSRSFGAALTSALKGAVVDGKGLDGVLRGLALRMSDIALSVGLKPLQGLLTSSISGLLGGATSMFSGGAAGASAGGGLSVGMGGLSLFAGSGVTPFAKGGVVAAPTYFGSGGGVGLMGEAGAEAILPLQRGPDGALGVAAADSGSAPRIVFNVTAQDAASFRKSEGQIAAMLTRAVGRGQRSL